MSIYGNPVLLGGGGGGTIEPLSVTQNGTYTASGGVDGYSPVTVNVQGGDDSFTLTKYIQSSGTQYINTGYVPISTTRFEVVANVQASGSYPALFGERASVPSGIVVFIRFNYANALSMQWANGDTAFTPTDWRGGWIGVKCKYILADGTRSVFDADGYGFGGIAAAGTGASLPIYIFTLNENNSPNGITFCSCKLYRFRIYEGNNLVHEFIPWQENGVACLKDTVTGNLKYNAGTGSFVYGVDA